MGAQDPTCNRKEMLLVPFGVVNATQRATFPDQRLKGYSWIQWNPRLTSMNLLRSTC